ncbi:MAG TPA: hypothetical protein VKR58_06105 [Aquella sp.]|nr:hypothetical protein [Aquella sp.]
MNKNPGHVVPSDGVPRTLDANPNGGSSDSGLTNRSSIFTADPHLVGGTDTARYVSVDDGTSEQVDSDHPGSVRPPITANSDPA